MPSFSRLASSLAALGCVVGLAACGTPTYNSQSTAYPAQSYPSSSYPAGNATSAYVEYGRVTAVDVVRMQEPSSGIGAGAVIGGIAGAVIGHQVGGGSGRDLATIAGGVGGAVAGNAIQRNSSAQGRDVYRVSVQTDNGAYRTYDLGGSTDLRTGDRVRIENGQLYRY